MTTNEDIIDALREKMLDPSLPSGTFDEYARRIKVLDNKD